MWKKILAIWSGVLLGCYLIDDFNPDTLKGKNVVVTGASTGIGEQIAYHYAKMGANVLITARREHRLQEVVAKCQELGRRNGKYHYIPADMSNLTSTEFVIKEAEAKLGGIDYLVLNHIINLPNKMWKGSIDQLASMHKIYDVNFKSYIYLMSHALPALEKSRGSIIVVSSFAGKVGQPYFVVYSSTKFALDGFFSSLRQEFALRNNGVSITMCIIGLVGTDNAITTLKYLGQQSILDNMKMADPSDTAYAIIRGGALCLREIYFPYLDTRIMVLLRDWFPNVVDYISRFLYTVS